MSASRPKKYHPVQVTLHWLVVLLVFAAFVIGKSMSEQPNDANKLAPLALHLGLGTFTLLLVVIRLAARMKFPAPEHASTGSAFLDWVGKAAHHALYLLVVLMSLSGMALSMQAGLAPLLFGGEGALPADFYDFTARAAHGLIAPAFALLILLHIGAAFYHQLILKDNLFARMWYGK